MPDTLFKQPRKALARWAALLLFALFLVLSYHVFFGYCVNVLRERSPWTYLKKAELCSARNDWKGAVRMLEEAAKRDPQSPLPWERLGALYYTQQKDWEKSLQAYRTALELGSGSVDARGKIIWCLIHLKRFDGAAEFGKACIESGYAAPNFPRFVAEALRRAARHAESIPYFEQALQGAPDDLYLVEMLMQAYNRIGNTQKANELKRRIEQLQEH